MFIAGNFISAIATVLDMILTFYMYVIVARAVISWVNPDPYNPIVQFLYKITEPVLYPIRMKMASFSTGIDLSPMILILLIYFLQIFLIGSLVGLSHRLQ